MEIPNEVKEFVAKKIELENFCLPHFYPELNNFNDFQMGYKVHGNTGKKITGEKEGDFRESWYVICSGYSNDPFFIDIEEKNKKFPVYFAWHGAGSWAPIKVTNNIEEFSKHLINIKNIENDKEKIISYLVENLDIKNEFWKEVYIEYMEKDIDEQADLEDWVSGKLIITNVGDKKLKIINLLKKEFKLAPQEALSLSKQKEIEFKEGYLKHLKFDIEKLNELGATTDFKPNKK